MPADFKSHIFQAMLNAWWLISNLAPYLAGGIVLAAIVNTFVPRHWLARRLGSKRWWMLPMSGLAGVASPACTYGTVPLFAEMVKGGAPMAPAATFLVSSALVNPQMFVLIAGALGIWVAVAQAAASFAFAVSIGILVNWLARHGADIRGTLLTQPDKDESESDAYESSHRRKHSHQKWPWWKRLGSNALDLTEFIGFYFVIGALVAALLSEFLPRGTVVEAVGQGHWWSIPFAAIFSIPVYVCGGGTIPFLAQIQAQGMSTGAVIAFLIAGPATRITALSALALLFKKRVVAVYVLLVLVFAIVAGIALGQIVAATPMPPFPGLGL